MLSSKSLKDVPFSWGEDQQEAFDYLKTSLATFQFLGTIQRHGQLIVDMNACDVAIGAILHQVQGDAERVLGYYSKSLNSAQRNYFTNKMEILAIVATLDHWGVYLSCVSEPFVMRTHHAALTWLCYIGAR